METLEILTGSISFSNLLVLVPWCSLVGVRHWSSSSDNFLENWEFCAEEDILSNWDGLGVDPGDFLEALSSFEP